MKNRKVALVGCGAVGTAFLYGAINQGLFDEYVLIDAFEGAAKGNAIDMSDAIPNLVYPPKSIKYGTFDDCSDADIIVITAGVAQKPGETRLQLVSRNAAIIKDIADGIKDSGFDGITVIASNPVDIITTLYQKITGFEPNKVIGSGTSLDSVRLNRLISEKYKVSPKSVCAYVVGEHGDSSVSVFSKATIGGIPLSKFGKRMSDSQQRKMHNEVMRMAYKIINLKRATFYGIGAACNKICRAVLHDENIVLPVSCITKGTYNLQVGWPAVINKDGWSRPLKLELNKDERTRFNKSCKQMKKVYDEIASELGIEE